MLLDQLCGAQLHMSSEEQLLRKEFFLSLAIYFCICLNCAQQFCTKCFQYFIKVITGGIFPVDVVENRLVCRYTYIQICIYINVDPGRNSCLFSSVIAAVRKCPTKEPQKLSCFVSVLIAIL
jgi:hypothetical protein